MEKIEIKTPNALLFQSYEFGAIWTREFKKLINRTLGAKIKKTKTGLNGTFVFQARGKGDFRFWLILIQNLN